MFDRGIRYYAKNNGGNDFIFEKIRPTLLENDLVVSNLEGPITENKSVDLYKFCTGPVGFEPTAPSLGEKCSNPG